MKKCGVIYLMYHELEVVGRALCKTGPGYIRYVIPADNFRAQLASLGAAEFRGLNVTEALADENRQEHCVVITFDDGCETDLLVAAPLLKEVAFNATFYVVAGFVGRPGYLSATQVRELSELGFEIGSHSMTHSYLPHLEEQELRAEIVDSKDRLEQLTGRRVAHFSCPGGRWQSRIAELALVAGYASVATSGIGTNSAATDRFRLSRIAVLRGTSTTTYMRLCRGEGLLALRAQSLLLTTAKDLLGDAMYERVRASVLG